MKLVSIIIPVYNVEAYLDRAVLSACNQTYRNTEIILVDDGSTDRSGEICDMWQKKDSRIRVIHKENGGLSSARNAGLDIATGDYIYFLDSDDYIKDNLLATVVPYLDNGIQLVSFNYYCVNGNEQKANSFQYRRYSIHSGEDRLNFIIGKVCNYAIGWEAWSRIFVKKIIDEHNLRFADNRKIFAEDLYFLLCYTAHIEQIVCIRDVLYFYEIRENSIMGNDLKKNNLGRFSLLAEAVYEHYKQSSCEYLLQNFPLIHWAVIKPEISRRFNACGVQKLPEDIRGVVPNDIFFKSNLSKAKKMFALLKYMHRTEVMQNKALVNYVLKGNSLKYRISSRIIRELNSHPRWFKNYCPGHKAAETKIKEFIRNPGRIYYLGTEEFGNVGDHLINVAVTEFLQKNFPGYSLLEITAPAYGLYRPFLLKYITEKDIIVTPGGGNWGDEYPVAENTRMDILSNWKNVPIIMFPQTIHYSDSEKGQKALAKAKAIIAEAKKLFICAREKVSFDFAQQHFSARSFLIPDIVFSKELNKMAERAKNRILWCMRDDLEKVLSGEDHEKLYAACRNLTDDIQKLDMQLPYDVFKEDRQLEIDAKLRQYFSGNLVITDRLHGMVCAAITGTPCVAFSNYNHKIRSTYEWIRHLPHIRFVNNVDEAISVIPELLSMKDCKYDDTPLKPYFEQLKNMIDECSE